jgi:hypothetical protein
MHGVPFCARPGCGGGLAAWLTYAYDVQTAWLDDRDSDGGGSRLALCLAHADGLKVPRGWSRRDRRTAQPAAPGLAQLFTPEAQVSAPEGRHDPAGAPETGPPPSALAV